ncbi:hypothetical protein NEMBOFW57_001726 [Staphylotrichum longicolle]|uniref:Uncharacterized protein n=1 Tax=Staphylotrichum longicolle TaxID=669026 RepID=A0AAD4I134_9PEZI|nr:hypothetical protein NEMBOFW57_001726 [Staphylotrichum longicolle]
MPPPTNNTTAAPSGPTPAKRFELPALDFKFGSLTEGTDIPPPLPSPIQEEAEPAPPDTPAVAQQPQEGTGATSGKPKAASPNSQLSSVSIAGSKRRAEDGPASPTLSNRPGSIRRLFSRGLLNTAYANGDETSQNGRPQSRGGSSVVDSRKAKRSSGWFGRLRSNDSSSNTTANNNKTAMPLSPPATDEKKPMGPPPPMIPELSELNSKLGIQPDNTFGNDLFKNIK